MKAKCPECGDRLIIDDLHEPGQKILCSHCGALFDSEAHLQDDNYKTEEEAYVVDWQL
ncbi:MAG TPA: hypothetical protein VK463_08095 [Desulfomonilaceae bacterium]|nr:hypothetical protein [Desulfomonilaceae bacterium]